MTMAKSETTAHGSYWRCAGMTDIYSAAVGSVFATPEEGVPG